MSSALPGSLTDETITQRLDLEILWATESAAPPFSPVSSLAAIRPPAHELASILLGLEEAYRVIAITLGYPPHFLKVVSLNNPELKLSLEGGKEAINALRELILVLPRFIASLFRPRAAWELAETEADKEKKKLEAEAANALADRTEAELRRTRAEIELATLQQQVAPMPILPDLQAHAVLWEMAKQMQRAEPARRHAFIAETAAYVVSTKGYSPASRVTIVPSP